MNKEVNPILVVIVVVVFLAAAVFFFFRATAPEGVKTARPPAPNPPGGIPVPTQ